ncbi:MAG TPA: hypothetical protein PKM65_06945 [Spirochaetota bacterium]|nr:hypothetical protein [Spirochaetota bacterium]HNT09905.1 hypothetical protein [Spirochaetota bacterium]
MKQIKPLLAILLAGCLVLTLGVTADAKSEKAKPDSKKSVAKDATDKKQGKANQTKEQKLLKENNKHTERMAKIERLTKLADEKKDKDLKKKAEKIREKELNRHAKALERINKMK